MKSAWFGLLVVLAPALFLSARAPAAQIGGGVTQVVCVGTACGGGGGNGNPCVGSQFCYRVKPNGHEITFLEVGVEDGTPAHYTDFCGPQGWDMDIVSAARSHDVAPTSHGVVSGKAGNCPFVLRFSGPGQTANFEVGYSYFGNPDTTRYHDANWKTSGGAQSGWTMPLGTNNGPVHSPVPLNVLVIILDDVGTDQLSLYDGNQAPPYAPITNLEELAADGIRFTSYYSPPLCSPARACMQTGRYALRTGMGNNSEVYKLPYSEILLPELLKIGFPPGMGYQSGAFGKWHLGQIDPGHPVGNGFDTFRGTLSNTVIYDFGIPGDHFHWAKFEHDAGDPPPTSYVTIETWVADTTRIDASTWIGAQNAPFFAWVAFNPPHVPSQVPPTLTADGRQLLLPATRDLLDNSGCGGAPEGAIADPACPDQEDLFYRAALEAVDNEIGYLIDDLSPVKRANTMIFVIGDNGTPKAFIHSEHDEEHGKGTPYQIGVRVPLIVSGPLTPPGGTLCAERVGAVDLWQTIADITGASLGPPHLPVGGSPYLIDSVSFLPLVLDPAGPCTAPWAFCQTFFAPQVYASVDDLVRHKRCITDGQFKYIRTIENHVPPGPVGTYVEEFYNVLSDPEEANDLWTLTLDHPVYLFLRNELEALSEY